MRTALLALCLSLLPITAAAGMPRCGPYEEQIAYLREVYDEHPVARALEARGGLLERLESRDGRTWTLIVISPSKIACVAAAGEHWHRLIHEPNRHGPET
ncbi:MAG: hypothetical protein QNJ62_05230 [Methyloceanibacter sp.]|nr:hypothetical protein [Methyloceanibacter sp.]